MCNLTAIDLNLLVALDLLLDEGSVRGAARRAHVTPSAMSHTLARLRALLGDDVLVRAGRGMVPTPRAEALAVPVKELLTAARAVLTDARGFDPASLRRRFRLVCTDHVSTVLLGAVEALLAREAPGVDLVVVSVGADTMEDLRRGRVDAAIGVFPDAAPEIRTRRLFTDRFVTVCRPDHPRLGDRLTLDAFLAEAHVLVAPRGSPEGTVDALLAERGLERRVARAFPGFLSALWHVAASDALLTVSARLVDAARERIPLRVFPTPLPVEPYTLVLAWHPRVDGAVDDAWFRSVLIRAADGLTG
ncbi:MAG: LysR family transcriptional regulator [Alphaproteobacteria bacterium]|nr:LysR family transcriptional regulator [Alphaproteobacteria bacterium]